MQQNLAHADQMNADVTLHNAMEYRQRLDELDREAQAVHLARMANENRMLERSVHNLMKDVQINRVWLAPFGMTSWSLLL